MVHPSFDLTEYKVVIAPLAYLLRPGFAARVEQFVSAGGAFVTTFFSGMVDENDRVTLGGYPGELRKLLGIWVEEYDVVKPDRPNQMVLKQPIGELTGSFKCGLLCALMHTETAEAAAVYGSDFYAGRPALTRNRFGKGTAWYAGSDPEAAMVGGSLAHICTEQGVEPILAAPPKVEVQQRKKAGQTFTFVLNHNEEAVERSGPCCRSGPAERQGTPRRSEAAGEGGVDHR